MLIGPRACSLFVLMPTSAPYLALIAEALADGALKQGLKREDAMAAMRGLFYGFGELIQDCTSITA